MDTARLLHDRVSRGGYRQAGMTAHAERIRPSIRRVSGRLQDDPILSADSANATDGAAQPDPSQGTT